MTKPVFVLITAETCSACKNFLPKWVEIKKKIEELGKVRIIEINVPDMKNAIIKEHLSSKGYSEDLLRYIRWFPTMSLFTGLNWDRVNQGLESKLDGKTFHPNSGMTEIGIMMWFAETLSQPPFSGDNPLVLSHSFEEGEEKGRGEEEDDEEVSVCMRIKICSRRR